MNYIKLLTIGVLSFTLLNCGPKEGDEDLTKNEAKKLKKGGDTTDYCDTFGWYKDGICDTFCENPDPECSECEAAPPCRPGYTQVDSCPTIPDGINAIAIASECEEVSICGSTIYCEQDPQPCLAIAVVCPPDFAEIYGECEGANDCIVIDDACGGRISCIPDQRACGGRTNQQVACNDNEFCHYQTEDICGAADASGLCQAKPDVCTEQYEPVCGCDGQTYGNECSANAAGTSIVSIGECQTQCGADSDCPAPEACINGSCQAQETCGGFAGVVCAEGQFCNFLLENMCGFADATGVCETKPQVCTEQYAPVCGCDGITYGNECSANAAGQAAVAIGECPTQCGADDDCNNGQTCVDNQCVASKICGGNSQNPGRCDADEFCHIATVDMCGAADAPGVCEVKPTACPRNYNPVCGCDQVTYSNECQANAAGMSVVSAGVCAP